MESEEGFCRRRGMNTRNSACEESICYNSMNENVVINNEWMAKSMTEDK